MRALDGFFIGLILIVAAGGCGDDGNNTETDAARIDAPTADAAPDVDGPPADAGDVQPTGCFDEEEFFSQPARMNAQGVNPMLVAPTSATAPDFNTMPGSPARTGGATPPSDGFFDAVTHRGAIGNTDWTAGWSAYPVNTTPADTGTVVTLTPTAGNEHVITTNTTWTTGTTYKLPTNLRVYVMSPAVLTIQPGVIVKGGVSSTIIITKGAKIDAQGTAAMPIVMTSDQPSGSATKGAWSGLVLLGAADTNNTAENGTVEGLEAADPRHAYGGDGTPDHDCGTLRYVRLEYTGAVISPGNEIQGLTMGGCGRDTEVDFLQSHRSDDDGIEIFGGNVNLKHVIISITDDDGLDWDRGWVGKAQHLIIFQAKDKAIEADNKNNAELTPPVSRPTIYNATIVGLGADGTTSQKGLHLRRGTGGIIKSSIITEFTSSATAHSIDVDGVGSFTEVVNDRLTVDSSMFFRNGTNSGGTYDDWPVGFDGSPQNDCAQ